MSKAFLIFTMPRCLSSWLSVFLTTDRSICFHDLAATAKALPVLPYEFVGMACTGAGVESDHWTGKYPSAPILIVHRDRTSSAGSLAKVIEEEVCPDALIPLQAALDALRHRRNELALVVRSDEVLERAVEIYHHCLPGLPLDMARLHELRTMNIQPHPPWMRAEIARLRKEGWPRA